MATTTTALDLDGLFGGLFTSPARRIPPIARAEPVPVSPTSVGNQAAAGLFTSPARIVPPRAIAQPVPVSPLSSPVQAAGSGLFNIQAPVPAPIARAEPVPVSPTSIGNQAAISPDLITGYAPVIERPLPVPVSPTSVGMTAAGGLNLSGSGLFSTPAPIARAEPVPVSPTVADLMSPDTASTADTALDSLPSASSFVPYEDSFSESNTTRYGARGDEIMGGNKLKTDYTEYASVDAVPDMTEGWSAGEFMDEDKAKAIYDFTKYSEFTMLLNNQAAIDGVDASTDKQQYSQEVLNKLGIPTQFQTKVETVDADGADRIHLATYTYNPKTHTFDSETIDMSPPDFMDYVGMAAKVGVTTLLTAGVAAGTSAVLAGTSAFAGVGAATTEAVGTAIAQAASTAIQGGDLGDAAVSAVTAGFGAYSEGINKAAEAVGATSEVIAQAEFINTISKSINIAEAVHNEDVLGVIGGVVNLTTNTSLSDTVSEYYSTTFPDVAFVTNNAEALSEASIKLADKLIQGENLEDSLQSAIFEYVNEDGTLSGLFEDGSMATPEWIKEFGDYITEGAKNVYHGVVEPVVDVIKEIGSGAIQTSKEILSEINSNVVKPALEAGGDALSALNESVLQPLVETGEEVLSDVNRNIIKPVLGATEEVLSDINDDLIKPVIGVAEETLSEANKTIVKPLLGATEEALSDVNRNVIKPVLGAVEELGSDVVEAVEPVYDFIKEQGGDLLETIGDGAEKVAQFLVDTGEPVVDFLAENGKEFADFLQEAGSDAVDWLQEKGGAIADWLQETGSSLADLLSQGWEAVKDLFDGLSLPDFGLPSGSSGSLGLMSEGDLAKRRSADVFKLKSTDEFTSLDNKLLA